MHRRALVVSLILALLLTGGLTYNVVDSQHSARAVIQAAFARRASLAGELTTAAVRPSAYASTGKTYFAGPRRGLHAAIAGYQGKDPAPGVVVLDGAGRVLAADPRSLGRDRRLLSDHAELREALSGRPAWSDLFRTAEGDAVVRMAVPFGTRHGRRVFGFAMPAETLQGFAGAFLESAPGIEGGRGYLLDRQDRVLASSVHGIVGAPLRDPGLLRALRDRSSGTSGGRTFVSAAVSTTPWRVVFAVPSAKLFAPVEGSARRATWQLFAALVAAMLGLLATLATALRRSAQLAHERLHDTLTGLPNRGLLLDRVDHALARARRSQRVVAVLFVDLDRFKAINDSFGHAAGDRLLNAVAGRLRDSVRPADTIGRFGGDEFVVLCEDLADPGEALSIAQRIQDALAGPVSLGGHETSVECSIGIAWTDATPIHGAQLIHDADLAMYRVKRAGAAGIGVTRAEHPGPPAGVLAHGGPADPRSSRAA
jgi:diguanylate cyclase (GGDEF)-like protein